MTTLAAQPSTPATRPGLRVMKDRNFWPFLVGNFLSNCGTWFQNLAQALLIYRLTKSTFLVGVGGFAQFVGSLGLAGWAGSAADRFDRRRLLLVTQLASFAITAVLATVTSVGAATAPIVIALALALGIASAFSTPAMQALVPLLVPPHALAGAVALSALTFTLARGVAPLVAAGVIGWLGLGAAFAVNSLSYLALVVGLLAVHPARQAPRPTTRPRLVDSIRSVRADPYVSRLLLTVLVLAVAAEPVTTLMPEFVTEVFRRPDTFVGVLMGAFGVGSAFAAFFVGRGRSDPLRRVSGVLGVTGGAMVLFALSPLFGLAAVALLVAGFGFLLTHTTATAALQLAVDDSQRGRVMALWGMAFLGVRPIASLVAGAAATVAGVRVATLVLAAPALIVAALMARRRDGPTSSRVLPTP